LKIEKRREDQHREGNHEGPERRRDHLEAFDCAEDRNCGSDDSVAVKQRRPDESENDDGLANPRITFSPLVLQDQRKQRENAAFSSVIRSKNEDDVLDADDENQRPQYEGQDSVDVRGSCGEAVFLLEALAESVKRAGPDVAVDDAESKKCQLSEALPFGVGLGMRTDGAAWFD